MAVKLYTLDELKAVKGLYADKALAKMNGDMEIYSTLLDKFLNQTPRTIPRLKQLLRDKKLHEYSEELKDLRIDLADIFAMDLLERANVLYDTAEKGEMERCVQQLEPFLQVLQTFAYEVKQCRTQEGLTNEGEAASKAAELDIGANVVNDKYASVNKAKFIDLYGRIEAGLNDKAINLTNVLKAMGYDAELNNYLQDISSRLGLNKTKEALADCGRLLTLIGCKIPAPKVKKFTALLVGAPELEERIAQVLGACLLGAATEEEALAQAGKHPDFILINGDADGGFMAAGHLRAKFYDIPLGFLFSKATPEAIMNARSLGAVESFLLPLDEKTFLEKMKKYMK